MQPLSFEKENLIVDWFTFNFEILDNSKKIKLANYFSKFGFNCSQLNLSLSKNESILFDPKNTYEILFVTNITNHWNGTSLIFSGKNAAYFYRLVKEKRISWKILEPGILSRMDLKYSRENLKEDSLSINQFFAICQKKIKNIVKNVKNQNNQKGSILKIGSRRSQNYGRLYTKNNALHFENEMTKRYIKNFHFYLISNCLDDFEDQLAAHFFRYFAKLLPLGYCYTDWLTKRLRPHFKTLIDGPYVATDYLESGTFEFSSEFSDQKQFVLFLQLLIFTQGLDSKIDYLGTTAYRQLKFKITDFLTFHDSTVNLKNNSYKLKQTKQFLTELPNGRLIKYFSDTKFQSLAIVPKVELSKEKKSWVAKVWLVEELFYYDYPFLFPDFFQGNRKLTKDEFLVRVQFIKVFSCVQFEKKFFVRQFLETYQVSNQRKTRMKRIFIQLVHLLQEHNLIEDQYKVILNGQMVPTRNFTTESISEGFVLYEKLSL
jgi:hypothetical protein